MPNLPKMDFKSLISKPKEKKEYFWSLLIEDQWVSSAIWIIESGNVQVVCSSPGTRWESDANLIEAIDTSLSACSQNLPEDIEEPSKTVFGVPSLWIKDGNIEESYLARLKKICQELSLDPAGFVVLSEAVAHYLKHEEGTMLTGIVVGVSDENLELSIFSSGKLMGSTIVARSVSIQEDMIEGLNRLSGNVETFPAKILLYNQKELELEEIRSSLDSAEWGEIGKSKFMHVPKVEIIEPHKKILAVCLAGGSEMGEVKGIVEGKDSLAEPDLTSEEEIENTESNVQERQDIKPEDLGFVVSGASVADTKSPTQFGSGFEIKEKEESKTFKPKLNLALPKIPQFNFKKPNFKLPAMNSTPFFVGLVALATFLIVAFVMWWFLPKASVIVYVSPKQLSETTNLSLEGDINSQTVEETVSGEKTKSTTGSKTVGDKAKGSLKIQNGTAFAINVPAGTVITSSSDLKFVTLKSASVSGALSPSSPGTATVDVEASSIGSEYNLAKDEVFKVGNYPKAEVDATSVDNISGGTSRQISAVSEEDRKELLEGLTEELTSEAKSKINENLGEGEILIDSSLESESQEEDFSNKVGDEASNLKLSLTLKFSGLKVAKSDLSNIAKRNLESKVPTGFVLKEDQIKYEFSSSSEEGKVEVDITANLLPNINPTDIAKKIAGKYPQRAEEYLASVPGFVRAEFRFKPLLPGKLGTLPHISKRISVELSAER